jgi:methyl-accepting chemotaxis protein
MTDIKLYALRKQLTETDLLNIAIARTALAEASSKLLEISVAHEHVDAVSAQTSALRRDVHAVMQQLDLQAADKFFADAQRALIANSQRVLDAQR